MKSLPRPGKTVSFALLILVLATRVSGCGSPAHFRGPGYDERRGVILEGAGDQLVLAVTHAVVAEGQEDEFDADLKRVLSDLAVQDGLIGYSLRRSRRGDEAWTLTVWRDEASLDAFVDTDAHLEAMRRSRATLRSVDVQRTPWPRSEMPPNWERVLPLLQSAAPREATTARASGSPVRE